MKGNIVFLTNIPAPYRERLHESLYAYYGEKYSVLYCSKIEKGRLWNIKTGNYKCRILSIDKHGIWHNARYLIKQLKALHPSSIILPMEFKPTFIVAIAYALWNKINIIFYTDATIDSEAHFSSLYVALRHLQCKTGDAFVCISNGGKALYRHYGVKEKKIFRSCLCADEHLFKPMAMEKLYDLAYVCYIHKRKLPFLFAEIAELSSGLSDKKMNVLIVGEGEERKALLDQLEKTGIAYHYVGYATSEELVKYYNQSKIFVFTTSRDAWGVTANEAMMCGLPVLVSRAAGCANNLVKDNVNGYVLGNEKPQEWAKQITTILKSPQLYQKFSEKAIETVQSYNYTTAAQGIIEAIESCSD